MLAVFMALSPRDRPRYFSESSRMRTRSNPLSPGLGFRPQPEVDKNLIKIQKNAPLNASNPYAKNLDQYLQVYYWKQDHVKKPENDEDSGEEKQEKREKPAKFIIRAPGSCTNNTNYGFNDGRPCVLVKMNKVVGFIPKTGSAPHEKEAYRNACDQKPNAIAVHCYGEYPADADNIGPVNYISENSWSPKCGSLDLKWFPYQGKSDRQDVYQAPYVWVQFLNPKPNVLINVLCRIYGHNIDFDKKAGRALTRFQLYVEDIALKRSEF